ncbi:MAG: hypothetical protein IJ306_06310 [Oscillospiraceae bacterium]|nr:hypothetical protein [Oscillospiraceae bacterium]
MVLQNEKCTAVVEIDESYVLGVDDENHNVVFNPKEFKNSDGYAAVRIIAKTDKTVKIAVICEYQVEFSAVLNGCELNLTVNGDAMIFNLRDGSLLHYEKDAVKEEFDFSLLDKMLE